MDAYQTFIDTLTADPAFPPDVIVTPLRSKGRVNFKRDKTSEVDQWQLAVDIDLTPADALAQIVTQHERARDRVIVTAMRKERDRQHQLIQEAFRDQLNAIAASQKIWLEKAQKAIQERHTAK